MPLIIIFVTGPLRRVTYKKVFRILRNLVFVIEKNSIHILPCVDG